ncbi:DUF2304 domain-containing protein [Priestia megaterium]|jgi:hypothetical protein|uniref:DUF2304 domain-containing protein n=1 Tax=Priestia megaterium TaxID=1404 RepID=A0ABD4WWP9_PRIMG|nr:DUF2304 domain-containing protein [Priestia megaterium]MBV6737770.1 DUF2304 domain-containing protein [Priestia megaterium]MBW0934234.1 DUF2304 domain-containing protein [Priestia megaterium]MCR8927419.1 DUF2304 domain-containing protein [Priestia megaterium]MDD1515373.1 DUF2304 domain-containing protein [Priestia megaterium]MDD9784658.1 DUF2304 domain-containing protein [Priestia megaterium]
MTAVQIVSICIALIFFIQVLIYTSKHKLKDQVAFFWMMVSLSGIIIAILLPIFNKITHKIGIAYTPSLLFLLAFIVVLNILIYQNIILSKQQDKLKDLTQQIAFLKHNLQTKEKDRH